MEEEDMTVYASLEVIHREMLKTGLEETDSQLCIDTAVFLNVYEFTPQKFPSTSLHKSV
jgi:hypothetical protein